MGAGHCGVGWEKHAWLSDRVRKCLILLFPTPKNRMLIDNVLFFL